MIGHFQPSYSKGHPPTPYTFESNKNEIDIAFRVTLGDMHLDDAFQINLSNVDPYMCMEALRDQIFGPVGKRNETIPQLLDVKNNPDLPEMYQSLIEIFANWREGKCLLKLHRNHGPIIRPTDLLHTHLTLTPNSHVESSQHISLDIVVEQIHTPVSYAANRWYGGSKIRLMNNLQETLLLHQISQSNIDLITNSSSTGSFYLRQIITRLLKKKYIIKNNANYIVTPKGETAITRMRTELANEIQPFDIFSDVKYHTPDRIEFGTGTGTDLRVAVYESEGLNAPEILLLKHIYGEVEDSNWFDWEKTILDISFFDKLLVGLCDIDQIEPIILEAIIESGFNQLERVYEIKEQGLQRLEIERHLN